MSITLVKETTIINDMACKDTKLKDPSGESTVFNALAQLQQEYKGLICTIAHYFRTKK